jgi:2-succinyl-5-enolpyruvyl-6-hydroxy-3-cyclohexene-1-carboxylate synthase
MECPLTLPKLEFSDTIKPEVTELIGLIQKEIDSSKRPLIIAGEKAPSTYLIEWLKEYKTPVLCDSLSLFENPNIQIEFFGTKTCLGIKSFLKL